MVRLWKTGKNAYGRARMIYSDEVYVYPLIQYVPKLFFTSPMPDNFNHW